MLETVRRAPRLGLAQLGESGFERQARSRNRPLHQSVDLRDVFIKSGFDDLDVRRPELGRINPQQPLNHSEEHDKDSPALILVAEPKMRLAVS